MMEGVASEAASLAGHLRLANLCWIYDDNTSPSKAYRPCLQRGRGRALHGLSAGTARLTDANDRPRFARASELRHPHDQPTLIVVDSHIGYGAPHKPDTAEAHGDARARTKYGGQAGLWLAGGRQFLVPDGVRAQFRRRIGAAARRCARTGQPPARPTPRPSPKEAAELDALLAGEAPKGWDQDLQVFAADPKGVATREASGKVLNAIAARVPWLIGGAGDLAPSTKTKLSFDGAGTLAPGEPGGRNLHFGVCDTPWEPS